MPQEASKIADPDSTVEAAAEAVAESSKQEDAAESGEESEEETTGQTEPVEGGEQATNIRYFSRSFL